mgnify:FL=1
MRIVLYVLAFILICATAGNAHYIEHYVDGPLARPRVRAARTLTARGYAEFERVATWRPCFRTDVGVWCVETVNGVVRVTLVF